MKRGFIGILGGIFLCVSGCSSGYAPSNAAIVETDVEAITFEASAVPEEEQELLESCPVGTFFMHPATKEGFLQIRVDSAAVYENWKEAELPFDELSQSTDSVSSMYEDIPFDQTMFYEDGGVVDGYQLIILSITIRNENAVEYEAADEFYISYLGITKKELLEKPDPDLSKAIPELEFVVRKCYSIAYFDAGMDSDKNYRKFQLPIGETAQMKLGFLVKESDLQEGKLVGTNGINCYNTTLFDLGLD